MPFPTEQSIAKKVDYGTPQDLFDYFHRMFDFNLDAAAHSDNHKTDRYLGPGGVTEDALHHDCQWNRLGNRIWLNFPYLRGTQDLWLDKAYQASRHSDTVVAVLCFMRISTAWWRRWTPLADTIFELTPRVRFQGAAHTAQVPNVVILYTPWSEGPPARRPVNWKETP
jgi:hypothetical protein